jgi:protein TonB
VVASVARRPTAPSATDEDAEGVTFNTREVMFQGYMDRLRDRVERVWRYPLEAAKRGIYGDLIIVFTVRRDGTLSDVRVKRTSGHSMLDQAAIEALREAEPFWPLPDDWGRESLTITGKFIYLNGRYYIR